ncbi:hypothetical protein TNCV_515721 [Trichonephila clavipes]|nr:hypothetical protein TNCV_515721 [Trichonephila clavipes]
MSLILNGQSHKHIDHIVSKLYCCASAASLEKWKDSARAARIITGLRRSCPKEIVLFEADPNLFILETKYPHRLLQKLSSYGHHNKTSLYFYNWHNNQRLKRNSPFSYASSAVALISYRTPLLKILFKSIRGTSQSPLPLQHVCPGHKARSHPSSS